ncbi:hypothetical protein DSO57_1009758 [Entomophthora muscae]|nr:hypothetical protein DSO57_1009758 [Entomophthora muscae]
MVVGVVVGAIHNLLWIWFSITNSLRKEKYSNPVIWIPTQCALLISLAMLLELFDFPPYFGFIDAHSLWHLATIFIIPKWYIFFCEDALYHKNYASKMASYLK